MNPLISVLVPNYNHEKYLTERLESIFSQTYSNYEVILLDDCSTDNSKEILAKYALNSKVSHCIFNEKNSGNTFKQWEKGISLAKGEFIWIAESDDVCDSQFINEVIKPLLKDDSVALSFCQSNKINEEGEITGNWKSQTENFNTNYFSEDQLSDGNYFIENFLIYKNVIPNASAVIFRKKIITEQNFLNFDHSLRYCGDWIFYFKVILNHKVAFVNTSYNNFRHHKKSVIATAVRVENRIRIIDIDFEMRNHIISFFKINRPYNFNEILRNNKKVVKNLKYEKTLLLLQEKKYFSGIILMFSNLDIFFIKHKPITFLKKKFSKVFNLNN